MTEQEIGWRRISKGLTLAGIGTFLLLTTLGVLTWSFWIDALAFWPVLLVAVGWRLIFERSRTPWLVMLSPLLILGMLTFVALRPPSVSPGGEDWTPLRVERSSEAGPWTLEGKLALSRLQIAAGPVPSGVLLEGRSAP